MLIFRALPLSFAILWRFAILVPVAVIFLAFFAIIGLVYFMLLALVFPAFALILALLMVFAFSDVIPGLIASRIGFQVKGVPVRNSYFGMVLPAVGYGVFSGFVWVVVLIIALGLALLISPLEWADVTAAFTRQGLDNGAVERLLYDNESLVSWGLIAATIVVAVMLRAALLVPLASASIGRDANGRPHTPFAGFGARFVPLFFVMVLSFGGYLLFEFGLGVLAGASALSDTVYPDRGLSDLVAQNGFGWLEVAILIAFILVWLWVYSYQAAAAVLVYESREAAQGIAAVEEAQAQRMETEDVRALWKDRMPAGRR